MGSRWQTSQLWLECDPQYTLILTYQWARWPMERTHDSSKPTIIDQKLGSGPIPGNLCPLPKLVGRILPLISLWNYPSHKTHFGTTDSPSAMAQTLSMECVSLWINPLLSYHFVSHQRTWTSLGPETRSVISVGRPWILSGFKPWPCEFHSQTGFWLGLSPSTWLQVLIGGKWFHEQTSEKMLH